MWCGADRGRVMVVEQVDDRTATELALHWAVHRAKRCMPVVGSSVLPTPWDLQHLRIDELLSQVTG